MSLLDKNNPSGGRYRHVLYDLDGTLIDPVAGITNSILHALHKLNIVEPEPDALKDFIGPPLAASFKRRYGLDDRLAWRAVEYYREYFTDQGIYENRLYPGIKELLARQAEKAAIYLATSKPTLYARRILRHYGLHTLFRDVVGSRMDGGRTDKADIVAMVMAKNGLGADETVMVGDRAYDVQGARANGVDAIAVAYGYGPLAELRAAGPAWLASSVAELSNLLCQLLLDGV